MADGKLRVLPLPVLRGLLRLEPERGPLLEEGLAPNALLERLCAAGLFAEAVRLLAHALPDREAVWWACMCVAHTARCPAPAERAALDAAEAWVWRPGEDTGREASLAASAAGHHLPGTWPALAAYWSQSSAEIARPAGRGADAAVVFDGPVGRGVASATALAARRNGAEGAAAALRSFAASGRDIAGGGAGRLPPPSSESAEDAA